MDAPLTARTSSTWTGTRWHMSIPTGIDSPPKKEVSLDGKGIFNKSPCSKFPYFVRLTKLGCSILMLIRTRHQLSGDKSRIHTTWEHHWTVFRRTGNWSEEKKSVVRQQPERITLRRSTSACPVGCWPHETGKLPGHSKRKQATSSSNVRY